MIKRDDKKLVVISTFDGMSCIQIILSKLGVDYTIYCSEIDTPAIDITSSNFPNTIHIGDISKVHYSNGVLTSENGVYDIGTVDLYVGGSPCQSLSGLGDGSGLSGKSGLFFEWLRLRDEVLAYNPSAYWMLENVVPKKKSWIAEITNLVGEEPYRGDSKYFLPIRRPRLFWCNWSIDDTLTKTVVDISTIIKDLAETPSNKLTNGRLKWVMGETSNTCFSKGYATIVEQDSISDCVFQCLTARSEGSWNSNYIIRSDGCITKLSCEEYERLQGVPTGYTQGVRETQRYKMIGNAWNINTVEYIIKQCPLMLKV